MIWLKVAYLLAAMTVCLLGAGVGIARRMVREPMVVLIASVGMGGIVLYLAAGTIYVLNISWQWSYLVTGSCAVALGWEWREIFRWWRDEKARRILIGWFLVGMWVLLADLEIRHFAIMTGDWYEHYERALYFLQHWAYSRPVFGPYLITARPPMMNITESFFLAQVGTGFELYQVASSFLNVTLYLAVAGLAVDWSGKKSALLAAALLALSPWFIQHSTYPWTKLYCTFYALLGIWFYRRSRAGRGNRETMRTLAYVMLTAGMLVHYTGVIVMVFIAAWDMVSDYKSWRPILLNWIGGALLFSTWVGWAYLHLSARDIVTATSTANEAQKSNAPALVQNFLLNGSYSLIPRALHPAGVRALWDVNEYVPVKLSDLLLLSYQDGLLLAWGIGGAAALAWGLGHASGYRNKKFWIGLTAWIFVGGLLVHTPPAVGGVADVLFQPVVWVGMAWLISLTARMPQWLLRIWWAGILLDFLWIALHIGLEGRVIDYAINGNIYAPADPRAVRRTTFINVMVTVTKHARFLGVETYAYDELVITGFICGGLAWWWWAGRIFFRREKKGLS